MSLANMYTELHRQAERHGEDRAIELKGGARLAVRCKEGVTTLTISRKGKKVGDTELITFRRDCNVPANAIRFPLVEQGQRKDGDGVVWHYIAFRWREP